MKKIKEFFKSRFEYNFKEWKFIMLIAGIEIFSMSAMLWMHEVLPDNSTLLYRIIVGIIGTIIGSVLIYFSIRGLKATKIGDKNEKV
jgi:drug/metabolite transporter (DMT)-like permease